MHASGSAGHASPPQFSAASRILFGMEPEPRDDEDGLVRCLDCGTIYSQPAGERDIRVCPNCGYVGWIAVSMAQSARENGS